MSIKIEKAEGSYLFDDKGNRYINLSESINILGHRNPEILRIINSYLSEGYIHYPLTISSSETKERVEEKLISLTGIKEGFAVFSSSGSESCDIALTALSELGPVITLEGSYHGLTGQFVYKKEVDKIKFGSSFEAPFPLSPDALEKIEYLVKKGARSIILEVLQVEGGIREVYDGFLKDLRKEFPDLIIAVDEVYTGMGKTGKLFSYEWQNVVPDIIMLGKAIGGGFPLGITVFRKEIFKRSKFLNLLRNRVFGSTAGNILALHLADFLLETVSKESFLKDVLNKSNIFIKNLNGFNSVYLSGRGLILGLNVKKDKVDELITRLLKERIFVTKMRDVIRLAPPLTIPEELIYEAVDKIRKVLSEDAQ